MHESAAFNTLPRLEQIAAVLEVVGAHFGFSPAELRGTRRQGALSHARGSAIYLLYVLVPIGPAGLGSLFQGDHITALHAWRAIDERRRAHPDFDAELTTLRVRILDHAAPPPATIQAKPQRTHTRRLTRAPRH